MNKSALAIPALLAAALALVAGCVEPYGAVQHPLPPGAQPGPTVVNQAPPPPPQEFWGVPPMPEYAYAWMPGYWTWQGDWVWLKGSWASLPRPHAVWVAGQWAKRGHRYIWIRGHWQ